MVCGSFCLRVLFSEWEESDTNNVVRRNPKKEEEENWGAPGRDEQEDNPI
jgi:hypothetical protein